MPAGHQPILELHGHHEGLRRRRGASWGRLRAFRRRDPWSRRRERRGQEHADEDHRRRACGFLRPFVLDGREIRFRSARDAHAAGIAMVHQELSVAPDLTVAENVFLGNQPTNRFGIVQWRRMAREAGEQLKRFGIDVDPMSRLGDLPIGLQQLIEIARVLFSGARIIILDEPTSALSPPEVERLFATLQRLRDEGTSIVFISHFIEDILRVSDTVTVFRNGRKVAETRSGRDQQGGADRGDDRQGPRSARGELYARHHAAAARRSAGGAERERAVARPQPAGRLVRGPRRRSARHLRLHGLRPARTGADPVRQAEARPGHARHSRRPEGLPQHGRCPPRRDRLRAREPPRHAVPAGAGLQEHLDQHPRSHLVRCCSSRRASARSPRGRSSSYRSGPPRSISSSACCPAATSRRWRWRNG